MSIIASRIKKMQMMYFELKQITPILKAESLTVKVISV